MVEVMFPQSVLEDIPVGGPQSNIHMGIREIVIYGENSKVARRWSDQYCSPRGGRASLIAGGLSSTLATHVLMDGP
jgi:hypothetical protein